MARTVGLPEELRELSRLAIQYMLAREELWRFAEELKAELHVVLQLQL